MKQSGRTNRMLQYVIQRYRNHMPTMVVGANNNHAELLSKTLGELLTERDRALENKAPKIIFTSVGTLSDKQAMYQYNYRTNRFANSPGDPELEVVFDHFAMETHLPEVIAYLAATETIADPITWMIDTARVLSLTQSVHLIVPTDDIPFFEERLHGLPVTLEDGSMLRVLNWVSLRREGVKTQKQTLLFHPEHLRARFEGALSTITRF